MRLWVCGALLLAAGCGKKADTGETTVSLASKSSPIPTINVKEPPPPSPEKLAEIPVVTPPPDGEPRQAGVPMSVAPRIAYSYTYKYEVPTAKLAQVEHAHQALCDRLGPAKCQIVGATLEGRAGAYNAGTLSLRVAPDIARTFEGQLGQAVGAADGSLIQSGITGEDLTRQVIDSEAGLKAKRTLRDRLQALLETRQGKLNDLVELEKSLSETQQELDTATSELAELRGRIDMSKVEIAYEATLPSTAEERRPIAGALGSISDTLGGSVGLLINALAAFLPFAVVIGGLIALWRALRRRRRSRA